MRPATRGRALALVTSFLVTCPVWLACEAPQKTEERARLTGAAELIAQGRAELAKDHPDKAVKLFKQALSQTPRDVSVYLHLADAYRASGNEAAAVLTLRQAEAATGVDDPNLKRARAELFLAMHDLRGAVGELTALREADLLTDAELRELAVLQARTGHADDGFATLTAIYKRTPDDPETKVTEARVLYLKGDDVLGRKLVDRLVLAQPTLASARLLRAQRLALDGQLEPALADLTAAGLADEGHALALERARVLNLLQRHEDAARVVDAVLEEDPRSAEGLALLAETRLLQGKEADAQVAIEQALAFDPRSVRALYVRGRAAELQDRLDPAQVDYEAALKTDEAFVPALSRLWRVFDRKGSKADALATLERLYRLNALTADEKVALARLDADTWANVQRGRALIDEALKRDPQNAEYRAIKARLARSAAKPAGVVIMKGR